MKIVILMAGVGARLGHPFPKALTPLRDGLTILDHQLRNLAGANSDLIGVVGFKRELIMERHPELRYVENPRYDQTNTARSLACALEHVTDEDVLWLNGDVVFDGRIITEMRRRPQSGMAVVNGPVDDEAIKYQLDGRGRIRAVSKSVAGSPGEAIGINLVRANDLELLKDGLRRCSDQDYFERGIELAIGNGMDVRAVDVSRYPCVEVDFLQDLEAARRIL